jgi:RpiB/LacA/LacB family sugar-phosphate isomerase
MKIAIGCDHRGYNLKQQIIKYLPDIGHTFQDFGCYSTDSVDYPDIAREVALIVASGEFKRGILICGTGLGMSIAANKIRGIRAALSTMHLQPAEQENIMMQTYFASKERI